jgi:hypothetical protein
MAFQTGGYDQVIANGTLKREPLPVQHWSGATGQLSFAKASDAVYGGHAARWTATGDAETVIIDTILPTNFVKCEPVLEGQIGYLAFDYYAYKTGGSSAAVQLFFTITIGANSVTNIAYEPALAASWAAAQATKQRIEISRLFANAGYTINPGDKVSIEVALSEAAGNPLVFVPDPTSALIFATHDTRKNLIQAIV